MSPARGVMYFRGHLLKKNSAAEDFIFDLNAQQTITRSITCVAVAT